jgi:hypothetical protein
MKSSNRSAIALGLLLVLLGVFLVLLQVYAPLRDLMQLHFTWPWIVIGVGIFLLILGLLVRAPEMAVPACIVGGIGGILYYQNTTQDWGSWAYMWALIPGFAGVGMLITRLLGGNAGDDAVGSILTSGVLFVIFASFFGGLQWVGPYWPVLLIALGIYILLRPVFKRKKVSSQ